MATREFRSLPVYENGPKLSAKVLKRNMESVYLASVARSRLTVRQTDGVRVNDAGRSKGNFVMKLIEELLPCSERRLMSCWCLIARESEEPLYEKSS